MKFAVVRFPGSNCDQDCYNTLAHVLKQEVRYAWHKDTTIAEDEVVVLPGGFSYGDYLRCGAIARFSPILHAVKAAADRGQIVIGICNGFQVLCEAGLLPGMLIRNRNLHFVCEHSNIRVETIHSAFTSHYTTGRVLRLPVAHGEGCYIAEPDVLESLEKNQQVIFRYVDSFGRPVPEASPNGSTANIAGIRNKKGNVLGLMPHPERAGEALLGSVDGLGIFQSILAGDSAYCVEMKS